MTFKNKLHRAVDVLLEDESEQQRAGPPARLQDTDVDSFMLAAEGRDDPLWTDIHQFLEGELARGSALTQIRANRIKSDIKWLRKRAARAGLDWGRE